MKRNDKKDILYIVGRIDDPRITHCRFIVDEMAKNVNDLQKIEFVLAFETQFESLKEDLLKENLEFLRFTKSPIIYLQDENKKKKIIGSLEEFLIYIVENYMYHETRETKEFNDITKTLFNKFISTNGNKYCYFDFNIEGCKKKLDRVVLELFANECPKTSENFLRICQGVNNSKKEKLTYKGTCIHRIVKNGFIQGGDLSKLKISGEKSIYMGEFPDESYNVPHLCAGMLGMVKKAGRNHSNECQFYITLTEMKCFDKILIAFGRIVQGLDVIKEIAEVETFLQRPTRKIQVIDCGEFMI